MSKNLIVDETKKVVHVNMAELSKKEVAQITKYENEGYKIIRKID